MAFNPFRDHVDDQDDDNGGILDIEDDDDDGDGIRDREVYIVFSINTFITENKKSHSFLFSQDDDWFAHDEM